MWERRMSDAQFSLLISVIVGGIIGIITAIVYTDR
jgi:hypothetical protein